MEGLLLLDESRYFGGRTGDCLAGIQVPGSKRRGGPAKNHETKRERIDSKAISIQTKMFSLLFTYCCCVPHGTVAFVLPKHSHGNLTHSLILLFLSYISVILINSLFSFFTYLLTYHYRTYILYHHHNIVICIINNLLPFASLRSDSL